MKKRILLALDLEGVNLVVGEPYMGLVKGCEEWERAREQAVKEINAAARALFLAGAETVALWDNHGGGHNIAPGLLDSRITLLDPDMSLPRMYFAEDYDCLCFFGYHAMEGTLGGVLAHTMNSKCNQYYKLNGRYIGEIDMDAYIASSFGVPSCFFAGGDIACRQASRSVPGIVTVVTKTELERNKAIFRDNDELLQEIGERIVEAVRTEIAPEALTFPATMEKSFKRTEDAAKYLEGLKEKGISAEYPFDDILGRDAHTVVSEINSIGEFIAAI